MLITYRLPQFLIFPLSSSFRSLFFNTREYPVMSEVTWAQESPAHTNVTGSDHHTEKPNTDGLTREPNWGWTLRSPFGPP